MKRSYTFTETSSDFGVIIDFIKDCFNKMEEDLVVEYVSIERTYEDPNAYYASFSARSPVPEYDVVE